VRAIKKVALAGVDIKYIGTNDKHNPRMVSILNLQNNHYTVNYPNITCKEVVALAKCPNQLRN
jgi:hypothetical protein